MNTYTIYLGAKRIACVDSKGAYSCFEATKTLAEFTGTDAILVWDATGEEVAYYNPNTDRE